MAAEDAQQPTTKEYIGNYPGFRITSGVKIPEYLSSKDIIFD